MYKKFILDIYNGERYNKSKHFPGVCFWSDDRCRYWGWIYGKSGEIEGDFSAASMQIAEKRLGVKFKEIA